MHIWCLGFDVAVAYADTDSAIALLINKWKLAHWPLPNNTQETQCSWFCRSEILKQDKITCLLHLIQSTSSLAFNRFERSPFEDNDTVTYYCLFLHSATKASISHPPNHFHCCVISLPVFTSKLSNSRKLPNNKNCQE